MSRRPVRRRPWRLPREPRVDRGGLFGVRLAAVDVRHRCGEKDDLRSETTERSDRVFEVEEVHPDSAGDRLSRVRGLDREVASLCLSDEVLAEESTPSDHEDVRQRSPDASADSNPFPVEGFQSPLPSVGPMTRLLVTAEPGSSVPTSRGGPRSRP